MAKIIKRGTKTVTCWNCKSVIEYEQKEVKSEFRRDYSGGGDTVEYFDCPACDEEIHV